MVEKSSVKLKILEDNDLSIKVLNKNPDINKKYNIDYNLDISNIQSMIDKLKKSNFKEEFNLLSELEDLEHNHKRKVCGKNNEDRYSDIYPFKYSKVALNNVDYINACWVHVSKYFYIIK